LEAELTHNPEGLITLALNKGKSSNSDDTEFKAKMVAGVGFEPTAFRL